MWCVPRLAVCDIKKCIPDVYSSDHVGVPVAELHYGNYEATLDLFHDHVLCCIENSCNQMQMDKIDSVSTDPSNS